MKLETAIKLADILAPNAIPLELKVHYLNEVEGLVATDVLRIALTDIPVYTEEGLDIEMLVKPPHDKLYVDYLTSLIFFANGEYDKYANTIGRFNTSYAEYNSFVFDRFHPADGGCVNEGYYLSAYAIALNHGYVGSEEEWLNSLKGDNGESPHIGENGNWWIGTTDTGVKAEGEKGAPGDDYVLTEADKVEIAQLAANPTAARVALAADGWTDDSDLYGVEKKMYLGYRTTKGGTLNYIKGAGNEIIPTYEWMTYSFPFTLSAQAPQFSLTFRGGTRTEYVHPYDFMDVVVYKASDASKTNLLSDDIEVQRWLSGHPNVKNAITTSDGVKYQHVYRQAFEGVAYNYAQINSNQAVSLEAGNYVVEFKMRLTPWLYSYVVSVPNAHSEYCAMIYPSNDTADTYVAHNIRCLSFGNQTIVFIADTLPSVDVSANVMISKSNGAQGLIFQMPSSDIYANALDTALLPLIGEV